jgi:hypothetical protein
MMIISTVLNMHAGVDVFFMIFAVLVYFACEVSHVPNLHVPNLHEVSHVPFVHM